jgi:hypothetical protein
MTSAEVAALVARELQAYVYVPPLPGETMGVPWSGDLVSEHVSLLRSAMVEPYLRDFLLCDTYEQLSRHMKEVVQYWVVARTPLYLEFFDPCKQEFGLAELEMDGKIPSTIGVRGDLVGVFCAM